MSYNIILDAEEKFNSLSEDQQKEMMKDLFLLILLRNLEDYGLDLILKKIPTKKLPNEFQECTFKHFKEETMKASAIVNILFNKLNEEIIEFNGDPRINIFATFQNSNLGSYISFIPKYEPKTDTMTFVFKRKFDF